MWTLKNQFQLQIKRRFLTHFLCMSNHLQPLRDLRKGETVYDETCPCVHWCTLRSFWSFVIICDFINNKNSTVIFKLWTCIVHVCHLKVKYYTGEVVMFEYPLSNQLCTATHFRTDVRINVSVSMWRTHSWSLSKHFRYTLYKEWLSTYSLFYTFLCNNF